MCTSFYRQCKTQNSNNSKKGNKLVSAEKNDANINDFDDSKLDTAKTVLSVFKFRLNRWKKLWNRNRPIVAEVTNWRNDVQKYKYLGRTARCFEDFVDVESHSWWQMFFSLKFLTVAHYRLATRVVGAPPAHRNSQRDNFGKLSGVWVQLSKKLQRDRPTEITWLDSAHPSTKGSEG